MTFFIFLLFLKYAHKLLLGDRGTVGGGPASRDVSKNWLVSALEELKNLKKVSVSGPLPPDAPLLPPLLGNHTA